MEPRIEPEPGTYAYTAWIMNQIMPPDEEDLPDDFWDTWKDEIQEMIQ